MLKRISTNEWGLPSQKTTLVFTCATTFILAATIFQDFLHSQRNGYAFYISESLLFNTFWLLFFPVAFLQIAISGKIECLTQRISGYFSVLFFVLSASVIHVLLFSVSILGMSALFFDHTYDFKHNLDYTISHDFYKYLFSYATIALLHFRKGFFSKDDKAESTGVPTIQFVDKIIVGTTSRNHVVVATEDIFFMGSSSPYISIHTQDKKHLHAGTLKSIIETLDDNQFVRIHKSTIVNLKKVVSYKSRLNGDYDVLLANQQEVRLSRNYVKLFRERLGELSSP